MAYMTIALNFYVILPAAIYCRYGAHQNPITWEVEFLCPLWEQTDIIGGLMIEEVSRLPSLGGLLMGISKAVLTFGKRQSLSTSFGVDSDCRHCARLYDRWILHPARYCFGSVQGR